MRVRVFIHHATRMRRIMSSCVACVAPPNFSTFSFKRHDFRKEIIENKTCFDFLYNFYLKCFLFDEELREILS